MCSVFHGQKDFTERVFLWLGPSSGPEFRTVFHCCPPSHGQFSSSGNMLLYLLVRFPFKVTETA